MPTITIEVFQKNVAFRDDPPAVGAGAAKLGDQTFFTDDLLDSAGREVGTHSGFCTRLRVTPGAAPDLYQCQATYVLHPATGTSQPQRGQVTARGAANIPLAVNQSVKSAITGGTDAYMNARGEVTVTQLADRQRFVLDLVV
jgi:hypothetical protein